MSPTSAVNLCSQVSKFAANVIEFRLFRSRDTWLFMRFFANYENLNGNNGYIIDAKCICVRQSLLSKSSRRGGT